MGHEHTALPSYILQLILLPVSKKHECHWHNLFKKVLFFTFKLWIKAVYFLRSKMDEYRLDENLITY